MSSSFFLMSYYDNVTPTNTTTTPDDGCYRITGSVYIQPYTFILAGIIKGLILLYLTNRFTVLILQCVKSKLARTLVPVINTTQPGTIDQMNSDACEILKLMKLTPSPAAVYALNCAIVSFEVEIDSECLSEDPILRGIPIQDPISLNALETLSKKKDVRMSLRDPDVALAYSVLYHILKQNLFPVDPSEEPSPTSIVSSSTSPRRKEQKTESEIGENDGFSERLLNRGEQNKNTTNKDHHSPRSADSSSLNETSESVHGLGPVLLSNEVIYDATAFGSLVPLWWLQVLSAISIVFLFVSFLAASIKDENALTTWEVYEGLYARVANSGLVAIAFTNIGMNSVLKFLQRVFGSHAHQKYVEKYDHPDGSNSSTANYSSTASSSKKSNPKNNKVKKHNKQSPNDEACDNTLMILRETHDPLRSRDPLLGHELSKVKSRYLQYVLVLLLPGLLTHSLPMLFVYIWIPVLFIALLLVVAVLIISRGTSHHIQRSFENGLAVSVISFVFSVSISLFLEVSFNWAVLFYNKEELGLSYLGVIGRDFDSRSNKCWTMHQIENYRADIQTFSSWLQLLSVAFP